MKVLIVDDYPNAAEVTCTLVRLLGHHAVSATTGQRALEIAAEQDVDVVLLDIGLPDLDGYEVARRLRAMPKRRPFIAALTGWGQAADRVRSIAAGIDRHFVKPASAELLSAVFTAAVNAPREAGA